MRNGKRVLAAVLAAAMGITSVVMPADNVRAAGHVDETTVGMTEEEEKAIAAADGVEIADLPAEDGAYVVYMEPDKVEETLLDNAVQEIAVEAPEVIVETDLSAAEVAELEAQSSRSEEIYIEENFFLEGSSYLSDTEEGEGDGEENDTFETDASFLEGMDLKARYEWKRSQIRQETETGEAEWNIQMIHADEVTGENAGAPVKVAVLDSGVEFLAGIPVERSINLVKDEQELPYYMNDMTGHGTAIADIIHQVCPQAEIYSVKVMDGKNRGRLSDVVAGIYWCIEQDVDIINMSFGTGVKSDILEKAIQAAAEQGIMMVGAAGNGGTGSAVEYPAAFSEVIAVGAVNTGAEKTAESATGEEVELAAPGEQIASKSMLGLETVNSGTSMAAPHVTGAAALLMQQSEYRDVSFIRRVLQKSSNPLGDETYYGSGLLDVAYAQELLAESEEVVMAGEYDPTEGEDRSDSTEGQEEAGDPETIEGLTAQEADGTAELTLGEADGTADVMDTDNDSQGSEPEAALELNPVDVLEEAGQSDRPIETFEETDYVEGRWGWKSGHGPLAEEMGKEFEYNETEIKILKAGAVHPDQTESGMKGGSSHPEWHGWRTSNYVANYIFATRIAKAGGDTTNLKMVNGQDKNEYDKIKKKISLEKVYGINWREIFAQYAGTDKYIYDGLNEERRKHWRQLFLYGMAMHTATDAFAHSCYYKTSDGTYKRYLHDTNANYDDKYSADNKDHGPNRWKCAQRTAYDVMCNCLNKMEGFAEDFSSYGENYWGGFYMLDVYYYASKTLNVGEANDLKPLFKAVSDFSGVDLNGEKPPYVIMGID